MLRLHICFEAWKIFLVTFVQGKNTTLVFRNYYWLVRMRISPILKQWEYIIDRSYSFCQGTSVLIRIGSQDRKRRIMVERMIIEKYVPCIISNWQHPIYFPAMLIYEICHI